MGYQPGDSGSLEIPAAIAALSGFAIWRLRQPADPLRIRMIDYHYVLLFALIAELLILAHLVTLVTGQPFTGRRLGSRLAFGFLHLDVQTGA